MRNQATTRDETLAFKRARSHSGRVRAAKLALPFIAVAALLGGTYAIIAVQNAPDISVDLPGSAINDGRLVMANPKLDGFTAERKPYRVVANRAIQDLQGSKPIELEVLRADVELENGNTASLTSNMGTFDSETSILVLPEQGLLTTTDGTRAEFGRADINIQSGAVNATQNVRITSENSEITAETMQIIDGGNRIVFERAVRVIMEPSAPSSSDAGTGQ